MVLIQIHLFDHSKINNQLAVPTTPPAASGRGKSQVTHPSSLKALPPCPLRRAGLCAGDSAQLSPGGSGLFLFSLFPCETCTCKYCTPKSFGPAPRLWINKLRNRFFKVWPVVRVLVFGRLDSSRVH